MKTIFTKSRKIPYGTSSTRKTPPEKDTAYTADTVIATRNEDALMISFQANVNRIVPRNIEICITKKQTSIRNMYLRQYSNQWINECVDLNKSSPPIPLKLPG